jgi:hypothetical protein
MGDFASKSFWKSLRHVRAWIGVAALAMVAVNAMTGQRIVLPAWMWLLVALACAISKQLAKRIAAVVLVMAGGLVALLLALWAISVIDFAAGPENCAFNSVTEDQYQQLLVQAKAQRWTVWPGLSNGIFWPSEQPPADRDPHPDYLPQYLPQRLKAAYGPATDEKLLALIRQLVGPQSRSADRELAAAHALMRGIGAELVSIFNIAPYDGHSKIDFTYFLPQRRFAPLCLLCWLLPYTRIQVVFDRPVATGIVALDRVVVVHSKLDGNPSKEPNIEGPCPAFPPSRRGR